MSRRHYLNQTELLEVRGTLAEARDSVSVGRLRKRLADAHTMMGRLAHTRTGGDEMEKFWMVWKVGTPKVRVQHSSLDSAIEEAKRLAEVEKQGKFIVLEAVRMVRPVTVAVSVEDMEPVADSSGSYGTPIQRFSPEAAAVATPGPEASLVGGYPEDDIPF